MKKTVSLLITGLLAVTLYIPQAQAFSDLSQNHPNYQAIEYLRENGILNGYSDGTFRPNDTVNRAEFLKIIIEGSDISVNSTSTPPFTDINFNAWYTPYIKKAYQEGWVVGYGDNTFRPNQTISKAEALKILGEVQNWQLKERITEKPFEDVYKMAWFTPYIDYAKDHDYLEEDSNLFFPNANMTRGKISEIIYRTLTYENFYEEIPDSNDPKITETEEINLENIERIDDDYIPEDFFKDLTLKTPLPTTFYKNEVYVVQAETEGNNGKLASIILEEADGNDYHIFEQTIDNKSFEIPIHFEKNGEYLIGIVLGDETSSYAAEIEVNSSLPNSDEDLDRPEIDYYSIEFEKGLTKVNYNIESPSLKKLTFTQRTRSKSYLSRQNIGYIPVNFVDFEKFSPGEVGFYLEAATLEDQDNFLIASDFKRTVTDYFEATKHGFSEIVEEHIDATPPETIDYKDEIEFSGTTKANTEKQAYVIRPDGFIDYVELSTNSSNLENFLGKEIIKENSDFSFSYEPDQKGTYIIEISDQFGLPLLNHPVYVGEVIPLIPDYFDKNIRDFYDGDFDLIDMREDMLQLINESRGEHGLAPLDLSDELSSIAQDHSRDMAENDYFSHVNLEGETPEDRRVKENFPTPVSENIAKDVSLRFAHEGLMRSASHRENILDELWTKVGIGIFLKDGYLYITEEFTTSEIEPDQLIEYKNELLNAITQERTAKGLDELDYDETMENICKYVNDQAISHNEEINADTLDEALSLYEVYGTSISIGRVYGSWEPIKESILDEEDSLFESDWEKIGIDIQIGPLGSIYTIITLNES